MTKNENIRSSIVLRMFLYLFIVFLAGCDPTKPSDPLTPFEELDSFVLADADLSIQLVAAEPLIQDPVTITFDGAGRLWVVEMRGFMPDLDGNGEEDKIGRISVLFDDDGDGKMDRSTIFQDSLVLPRAIALVKGGALIAENIPLWYVEDTDGDFKADRKTLIDSTYGGQGMPEHSANGLWMGLDNWYYNAKSKYRYKKKNNQWVRQETEFRGQWGISHDNAGRLFYNYNWSQLHGDLVPPGALHANKNHIPSSGIDYGLTLERNIFPIRSNPAVNRGYVPGTFDGNGRLLEFTAACSPLVFRGTALPKNYLDDIFVCEPAANLIRRNIISEDGFMLSAKGAYKDREFLASTDERFRPVSLASGPDGAIYVVDMYKGIIQDGTYMTPYLREVSLERNLDKPIHMGRIWRIASKSRKSKKSAITNNENTSGLLTLLSDQNGWTRDFAQRLLVEKQDLSAVPDLEKIVSQGNPLGQLHALWTLEGLGHADPNAYKDALRATDPKVVQTALRILTAMVSDNPGLALEIERFINENYEQAKPIVKMQMVLASGVISSKTAFACQQKFLDQFGQNPVARDVVMSSLENREMDMLNYLLGQKNWKTYDQNKEIFLEMLATSIANKGAHMELEQLMALLMSKMDSSQIWIKTAVANGILNFNTTEDRESIAVSKKPSIFDNSYTAEALLTPLLQKLEKITVWPGKRRDVAKEGLSSHKVAPKVYSLGRQKFLNLCASCHGTRGEGIKRFAPPLKNSEYVKGEQYKLIMILLHGLEGPITVNGKKYDIPDILPSMPSFSTLQNDDISAIATYIRNSWGHAQSNVTSHDVGYIRFHTQGKIQPWKSIELDTLVFDMERK
ncbi:c-type cytochrome [Flavobacteriaceae bacterium F89]|uniref:C-type cytochrome n=1 Tax=Cerina litoralis TaxID=2874477 RepID=A0AAE3EUK3_9FLAO|nr:c-type cytochrome [Cerina litoralis]MCG2459922.1 c-type cytochrome [Cerina litoralis]